MVFLYFVKYHVMMKCS